MDFSIKKINAYLKTSEAKKKETEAKNAEKTNPAMDKKTLLIAGLTGLGIAGAATFAILKSKNLSKTKQAAIKTEKEASRLAEEQLKRAKMIAEEKAAILERKAAKEKAEAERISKNEAEKAAKIKAEEEARLAAERLANETAKKLHTQDLTELEKSIGDVNMKNLDWRSPAKDFYRKQDEYTFDSNRINGSKITTNAIDSLKTIEEKGRNISPEEIKEILKRQKCSEQNIQLIRDQIEDIKTEKRGSFYDEVYESGKHIFEKLPDCFKSINDAIESQKQFYINRIFPKITEITDNNRFIDSITKLMGETPKQDAEKTSQYLERIVNQHFLNARSKSDSFKTSIASKIKYSEDKAEEVVELTTAERKEIAKTLNELYGSNEFSENSPIEHLTTKWVYKYISGMTVSFNNKLDRAIFSGIPRYDSSKLSWKTDKAFAKEPVYRWMNIKNIDEFLQQFQKEGCEYSHNRIMSFSKSRECGEYNPMSGFINFADWSREYNVKFVVHPKNTISQAAELGEGKYGNQEVLYPSGQKFKFLGKINKEITPLDYPGEKFDSFSRWEIHLQEM